MSRFRDAIWDGIYCNLSLFSLFYEIPVTAPDVSASGVKPTKSVVPFVLEDELGVIGNKSLILYDITLDSVPDDLAGFLIAVSESVDKLGAIGCWFAFDAGFSFENLLSPNIADEIFFIRKDDVIEMAIEDAVLEGAEWRQKIAHFRSQIV